MRNTPGGVKHAGFSVCMQGLVCACIICNVEARIPQLLCVFELSNARREKIPVSDGIREQSVFIAVIANLDWYVAIVVLRAIRDARWVAGGL